MPDRAQRQAQTGAHGNEKERDCSCHDCTCQYGAPVKATDLVTNDGRSVVAENGGSGHGCALFAIFSRLVTWLGLHGSTVAQLMGNYISRLALLLRLTKESSMRSGLLWLIGIPLPIILILWLVTGHA